MMSGMAEAPYVAEAMPRELRLSRLRAQDRECELSKLRKLAHSDS
jgi:hypothetical protein